MGGAIKPAEIKLASVEPTGKIAINKILKDAALLGPAPYLTEYVHGLTDMIDRNMIGGDQYAHRFHASNENELHTALTKLTTGRGHKHDHPRVARAIFESFKHAPKIAALYQRS